MSEEKFNQDSDGQELDYDGESPKKSSIIES
jgi:hypothetical protein